MNIREIDQHFSIAEQVYLADLGTLAELGYTDVVCNRPDGEDPGQPSFAELEMEAASHGLKLHFLAIDGPNIDPGHIHGLRQVLDEASGKTVGFCRTGNRSLLLYSRVDANA